jgi:hypothetical protein
MIGESDKILKDLLFESCQTVELPLPPFSLLLSQRRRRSCLPSSTAPIHMTTDKDGWWGGLAGHQVRRLVRSLSLGRYAISSLTRREVVLEITLPAGNGMRLLASMEIDASVVAQSLLFSPSFHRLEGDVCSKRSGDQLHS